MVLLSTLAMSKTVKTVQTVFIGCNKSLRGDIRDGQKHFRYFFYSKLQIFI